MERRNAKRDNLAAAGATPVAHGDPASASATHVAHGACATQVADSAVCSATPVAASEVKVEVTISTSSSSRVPAAIVKEEHCSAASSGVRHAVKWEPTDVGQVITDQLIGLQRMHPTDHEAAIKYIEVFGEPLRVVSDSEDSES